MTAAAEFDQRFQAASGRLRLFAELRLGPRLAARVEPDDVLQDAYLDGLHAFDASAPRDGRGFVAWMCRIVENRVRGHADYFGARKRQPPGPAVSPSAVRDAAPDARTGPVTRAARNEAQDRLLEAIRDLGEAERDVVLRRYFTEQSIADIAHATGRSDSAVRRLLARATARLGADLLAGGHRP